MSFENWGEVKLRQFIDVVSGFAFPSENFTDGEGIPLIRIRDLTNLLTEVNYNGNFSDHYIVKTGDLLVGMDGDFITVKWKGDRALLNQRVCKLVSRDSNYLNQDFLFYRVIDEINYIHRVTSATTVKHLSSKDILSIQIDLPNVEEQAKIVAILSTIDRAIEQTEAIIAKQQRIKTGLMQDFLTKGIDEDGNVRSEATHKFKDSPLGRIPAEWEVKTLNKVASLQRGHDIREIDLIPGNCPVIASSGIIGFHKFSTSSAPNVVVGRKGSIGNVHYIDSDFWAHDTSLFVTNFFGNHEKYVYYLFSNLKLEQWFGQFLTGKLSIG